MLTDASISERIVNKIWDIWHWYVCLRFSLKAADLKITRNVDSTKNCTFPKQNYWNTLIWFLRISPYTIPKLSRNWILGFTWLPEITKFDGLLLFTIHFSASWNPLPLSRRWNWQLQTYILTLKNVHQGGGDLVILVTGYVFMSFSLEWDRWVEGGGLKYRWWTNVYLCVCLCASFVIFTLLCPYFHLYASYKPYTPSYLLALPIISRLHSQNIFDSLPFILYWTYR